MESKIQPLSYEQTQYLADLYYTLDVYELADAIEQFLCDYGYDESEDDDMDYETVTVSYEHRAGTMKQESE